MWKLLTVMVVLTSAVFLAAALVPKRDRPAGQSDMITDFDPIVATSPRNTASEDLQERRQLKLQELITADVIRGIYQPGTDPRLNVGPGWLLLDDADQLAAASLAYSYTFGLPEDAADFAEPLWIYADDVKIGHIDSGGLHQ